MSTTKALTGDTISDTVDITGLADLGDSSKLAVTVRGWLLGPLAPVKNSCDGLDWSGAPTALTIDPVPVTGSGKISDFGEYTIPKGLPGCYTYSEMLAGQIPRRKPRHER